MNRWAVLSANLLVGTTCFAGAMTGDIPCNGVFLGLGGSYNTINLKQTSWGEGISNIITNTGADSNGIAQGTGAPFYNTNNTFTPEIQAGYFSQIGIRKIYMASNFPINI